MADKSSRKNDPKHVASTDLEAKKAQSAEEMYRLSFGDVTHEAFARLGHGNHGRRGLVPAPVGNHGRCAILDDGDTRIRGSKIDADHLLHARSSRAERNERDERSETGATAITSQTNCGLRGT